MSMIGESIRGVAGVVMISLGIGRLALELELGTSKPGSGSSESGVGIVGIVGIGGRSNIPTTDVLVRPIELACLLWPPPRLADRRCRCAFSISDPPPSPPLPLPFPLKEARGEWDGKQLSAVDGARGGAVVSVSDVWGERDTERGREVDEEAAWVDVPEEREARKVLS